MWQISDQWFAVTQSTIQAAFCFILCWFVDQFVADCVF